MADRSVMVRLLANVTDFKASMKAAERSVSDLNTDLDQAGRAAQELGDKFQKGQEKVKESTEKTREQQEKLGLSAAEAMQRIGALRGELVMLGREKVGVGMDTVAARTELARLQKALAEIETANPDVRVDAETAAAEAQLRAIQSQLNSIDGKSVRASVDVDDNGSIQRAAAGVNGLASAALATSPALGAMGAAAVAGLGVIAPLASSAAAGVGVLALGFSGLSDAMTLLDQAGDATGEQLAKINAELAKVNPSTLEFARYIRSDVQPALRGLQESAASGLLPGVREGLDNLMPYLPRLSGFVGDLGGQLGDLAVEASRSLGSPVWQDFFSMIGDNAGPMMADFVRTLLNVGEGFAGVATAFAPMARDVSGGLVEMTQRFAEWGGQLAESQGFRTFTEYVAAQWPKIQQIVGNLAETIGAMIEAGAPLGATFLDAFVAFTEVLSAIPVGVVQALLTAFIGYKAVTGVADLINGVAASFGRLQTAASTIGLGHLGGVRDGITGVGGAAGAARANVDGFTGGFSRFSTVAGGAAAVAGSLMILGDAVSALDAAMAPTPPTIEATTAALLGLEAGIGTLDTMAQRLGENTTTEITGFGDAVARVANPGAMDQLNDFGAALFNVVTLGASDTGEGAASRRRTLEFLGGLDASLAQMTTSGNADLAAEKFRILTAEAEKHGVSVEQLKILFPEYQAALQGVANDQQITGEATAGTNAQFNAQITAVQMMVGSAQEQLGIYNELLQGKIAKDREAAQATAEATESTTDSWRDHVSNVNVSLAEYAAALDADVADKDAWRADIKAVTERGGAEVGAALLAMGEEGKRIADDMANATDEDFRRMADAMVNHARNGGAAANREQQLAMDMMNIISRDGARASADSIARELGIGVAEVGRISSNYGITLANGINPILNALGKASISIGNRAAQRAAGNGLQAANGGVFDFYADGGVESHVAQIAPAGSWRVWAEPETGGEAYIPLAPGKRSRSLDIWRETGRRLDAPEAQYFATGGFTGPDDVPRPRSTAPFGPPISTVADAMMQKGYDEAVAWLRENAPGLSGGTFGSSRSTPNGRGGLGPMAAAARQFVMDTFGVRNIGGYSYRTIAGTKTLSDHALGKAIDVMIPNYKSAQSIALGNRIASHFVSNPGQFGTKYVIWRDQINSGRGWGPYGHPGGGRSDTLQHRDHVHVSFYKKGGILNPHVRDTGGPLLPGFTYNGTGVPETVIPNHVVDAAATRAGGGAPQVVIHSPITFAGPVYGEQSMRAVAEQVVASRDEALARNVRSAWS